MTTKRAKLLRKELNKNKLYNYLVIHDMTVVQLSKMYGASYNLINTIIREQNFDYKLEKEKYKRELNGRMINSQKITRCNYIGRNTLKLA